MLMNTSRTVAALEYESMGMATVQRDTVLFLEVLTAVRDKCNN